MKKLLFVMSVISSLALLAPNPGFAEPTHPNEIGLFTTPNGYGETGTNIVGAPVNVFLVLTKPEVENAPCFGVEYFSCQLNFHPLGNLFLTGNVLNGDGFNIGDTYNLPSGYLEYIVGFANDVPTIDDAVLLVSLQFIVNTLDPIEVTLGPASIPAIPGQMDFSETTPHIEIMYSVGGSHDAPVFIFNGEAVPVEKESFGSVKALYR